ncbi:MAG: hypothetical protein K2W82_15395 [Candidatus Obscuribacterales bacterium]|nr:hypothetical protein [Candidatus Obscuribacterales bacterium]
MFAGLQQAQLLNLAVLVLILQQGVFLGPFHQGATWFHFFDKENRKQYLGLAENRRHFIYYPTALFLATIAGQFVCPEITALFYILWSLNHAVQQNIGILLLYHDPKKGEAVVDRSIELFSQRSAAVFFSLIFFDRVFFHYSFKEFFWHVAIALFGLVALFSAGQYCFVLYLKLSQGQKFNVPAFCFWLMSVLYLAPFAWLGQDYFQALFIPLIIHWMQYIGLNYSLVAEKYKDERLQLLPTVRPVLLFSAISLLFVLFLTAFSLLGNTVAEDSVLRKILVGAVLGFGMVHYYLDGRIWRFREAYARENMLPYLLAKRR